jgi:hypothetical protein
MNKANMSFKAIRFVLLVCLLVVWLGVYHAAGNDLPQTMAQEGDEPIASLFKEDPCAPPCFFGVTPGVSTIADVRRQLAPWIERGIFSTDFSQLSDDGWWHFFWWAGVVRPSPVIENAIVMEDNRVASMYIVMNRPLGLRDVLLAAGEPTFVLANGGFNITFWLVYPEHSITVTLFPPTEQCTLSTLDIDLEVSGVEYYHNLRSHLAFELRRLTRIDWATFSDWRLHPKDRSCQTAIQQVQTFYEGIPES